MHHKGWVVCVIVGGSGGGGWPWVLLPPLLLLLPWLACETAAWLGPACLSTRQMQVARLKQQLLVNQY